MNPESDQSNCKAKAAYAIAILGASLIVVVLVALMRHYTQPPLPNANRAAERSKALGEIRAVEADAFTRTAWLDEGKGIVRLKPADAMEIVQRWHDPALVRSNLTVRVEKANPPPPPPPPNPLE